MSPITFLQVFIVLLGGLLLFLVVRLALKINSAEEHNEKLREAVRKQSKNEKGAPPPAS